MEKEYTRKVWAVVKGSWLPDEQIERKGNLYEKFHTIFTTKRSAELWISKWKNSEDFKIVRAEVIYKV